MNCKHLVLMAVISSAVIACGEAPETAYKRLVFNAKTGNEAAFLKGFTKDSAKLVKTLLALRRTYGTQLEVDPYLSLALEEIQRIYGDAIGFHPVRQEIPDDHAAFDDDDLQDIADQLDEWKEDTEEVGALRIPPVPV